MKTRYDTRIWRHRDTEGDQILYKDIETQGYRGTHKMIQRYRETRILMDTSDDTGIQRQKDTKGHKS